MALPQAQLGSMPSISLGGYIPAARKDPSVLEQALMAFLGGAAGTAGNRLVDKALPDPQREAAQKMAQAQLDAQVENNKALIALGKDRNATDNRGLTIQEKNALEERLLRERLATAERLYNYFRGAEKNAIDVIGLRNTDENTKTGLRQQAARDKANADAELLRTQVQAVGTAAGARANNAQAEGLEAQNNAYSASQKQRTAKELLGNQPTAPAEPGFVAGAGQKIADYMRSGMNPMYAVFGPATEAVMSGDFGFEADRGWADGPKPTNPAPVKPGSQATVVPQTTPQHQFTPEEVEAMVRRIEMLAQQPLSP